MTVQLRIAQHPESDALLSRSPFALLVGMLLDQQFPMERAFAGPATIETRFGPLEPRAVADADPEAFADLCARTPAVHRYPGSMAARIQALAATLVEEYDGRAEAVWDTASTGRELLRRLQALPGFGAQKSKIFVALLAKQLDVRPEGWEAAAGDYAEPGCHRSVADVVDPESLQKVRDTKQRQKATARAAREASAARR